MPIVMIEWPDILGPTSEIVLEEYLFAMLVSLAASVATYALYVLFYRDWQRGAGIHRVFLLAGPAITLLFIAIQWSLPLSLGPARRALVRPLPHADQGSGRDRLPAGHHRVIDRRGDVQLRTGRHPLRHRRRGPGRAAHLLGHRAQRTRRGLARPDHHHARRRLRPARGRPARLPADQSQGLQDRVDHAEHRNRQPARNLPPLPDSTTAGPSSAKNSRPPCRPPRSISTSAKLTGTGAEGDRCPPQSSKLMRGGPRRLGWVRLPCAPATPERTERPVPASRRNPFSHA